MMPSTRSVTLALAVLGGRRVTTFLNDAESARGTWGLAHEWAKD